MSGEIDVRGELMEIRDRLRTAGEEGTGSSELLLEVSVQLTDLEPLFDVASLADAGELPAAGAEVASPAEFAAMWNAQQDYRRVEWLDSMQSSSRWAHRCFVENHDGRLARFELIRGRLLEQQSEQLEEVAGEVASHAERGYTAEHDDAQGIGHIAIEIAARLHGGPYVEDPAEQRKVLKQIAALAIAGMKLIDRQTERSIDGAGRG
jgi:hypothetical protein